MQVSYCLFLESDSKDSSQELSSICNVILPVPYLEETDTIKSAYEKVENHLSFILHCFGLPGSGKSQLVYALARKFPYPNKNSGKKSDLFIKWHVRCYNKSNTMTALKKSFEQLMEEMQEKNFCRNTSVEKIKKDFENSAGIFLEMLLNCKVPILILLEDPSNETRKWLQVFFQHLNGRFPESQLHVYVTSRQKSQVVAEEIFQSIKCYEAIEVKGFNQEEGIQFLKKKYNKGFVKEDFIHVFERFSGMPLGLIAANSYCRCAEIDYKTYLELAEGTDYISPLEEDAISKVFGKYAENVNIFQAIVMLFKPVGKINHVANASLDWRILCCISNFHHDGLPFFLLQSCCHAVRVCENKPKKHQNKKNEADTGTLITRLKDYAMCTEMPNGEIAFHEVVLKAFRLEAQKQVESFNPLKQAMKVMSGLMTMDIRRPENRDKMFQLRPHCEILLSHIDSNEEMLEEAMDPWLLKAIASHLYEVAGAILLYELRSKESENMFKTSLEKIWPEMIDEICISEQDEKNEKCEEIVHKVVETSKRKKEELSKDFIRSYASYIWLSHFEEEERDFLRKQSRGDFKKVETLLQNMGSRTELVSQLQRCGLFLSDERFRPVFFAERFASIMHRWSRYCLTGDTGDQPETEKGLWLSSLSNNVSKRVEEISGVTLITNWLSFSVLIPLLLKQKRSKKSLLQAQELCNAMMEKENLMVYENGLLKSVNYPPEVSKMFPLRNRVHINARLLVTTTTDETFQHQADEECRQLFDLLVSNKEKMMSVGSTLVYCAKYYCAKNDFAQAMVCFKEYFELPSRPKFLTECWAVSNYARAVCCHPQLLAKQDAIARCKALLFDSKKEIKVDIKNRLETYLEQLKAMREVV